MTAMPRITESAAVLLEARDRGVLRLTLNRPEARNALSVELMSALLEALDRAATDPEAGSSLSPAPVRPFAPDTICARCAPIRAARLTSASLPSAAS